jgi:hypothetical protein
MFYVGLYAALGMFGVVLQLTSAALQYTGASNFLVSVFSFGKDSFDFEYAPLLRSRLLITVIPYKPLSGTSLTSPCMFYNKKAQGKS